jgi:hypothetical protein
VSHVISLKRLDDLHVEVEFFSSVSQSSHSVVFEKVSFDQVTVFAIMSSDGFNELEKISGGFGPLVSRCVEAFDKCSEPTRL